MCRCGKQIHEGESIGLAGEEYVCIDCFDQLLGAHHDCAGLELPDVTLYG